MNSMLLGAIVVVAVVVIVVKRFLGEPLNARDLAVPPLVLVGIGIYTLTRVGQLSGSEIAWIAAGSIVGLALGAVRGTTVRLFSRDGVLWQRCSGWTVGIWVVSFAVSVGLGYLASSAGVREEARPLTLSIGVSMLGELATLGRRALSSGVPFAPDRR